jgi:serine/threonine-protein kinase
MLPGNRTGTPNYMAPEVVRRKPTDQRLDIFAYGVSMYELFAFELPWQRGDTGQAAMSHGQSDPPPLRKFYPKINPTLEAAIRKCMESEPENRFQTVTQYLKAISRVKHEDV